MLCPEVWTFQPPAASHSFKSGCLSDDSKNSGDDLVTRHHFNNLISVVIPNIKSVPDELATILNKGTDYYIIENISVAEFVSKEFIEAFVKQGHLTVLSHKTLIDVDDCMCITPCGELVLNILRQTYVELGLEGHPSSFSSGVPSRFIVSVDLCNSSFVPGKKNYERVRKCLQERFQKFDVLLVWDPPNADICPSSIAAYLYSKGYPVALCKTRVSKHLAQNVQVPLFPQNASDNEDAQNLVEWLGAFTLEADLTSESYDNYVTTYQTPTPNVNCSELLTLEWRGFFSAHRIYQLYGFLRMFVKEQNVNPWLSLHVQGYADSLLSWGKREHTFFTDGDNHYTIFLQPEMYITCSVWSSCRRPRKSTKVKKK